MDEETRDRIRASLERGELARVRTSSRSATRWFHFLQWMFIVAVVAFVAAWAAWRLVPPYLDRLYEQGSQQYRDGNFAAAADTLHRAHRWKPWDTRVNTLLGWSHWRLGQAALAEPYFARAYRADPQSEDARMGLAFASYANDHVDVAVPLFEELLRRHPSG